MEGQEREGEGRAEERECEVRRGVRGKGVVVVVRKGRGSCCW